MAVQKWERLSQETVARTRIFDLTLQMMRNPRNGVVRDINLLETRDWVNVVAVTTGHELVLVEQYRHGIDDVTLEIPGGIVDPGEDPRDTAVRELREETGYEGTHVTSLGAVQPNPAILGNLCHTYLVEECRSAHDLELDVGEDIEVQTMPVGEIPGAIASGRIRHALVVCGIWWLATRRPDLLPGLG
ncbi:MAG TPA: NUDIX hydrolase [Candidatus Krumholzibacteria bacterium]|nr:NUDIX hydrolase [Candidatus Krumholzibacteria bacterium]